MLRFSPSGIAPRAGSVPTPKCDFLITACGGQLPYQKKFHTNSDGFRVIFVDARLLFLVPFSAPVVALSRQIR